MEPRLTLRGATCAIWDQIRMNTPRLNPQPERLAPVLDLPTPEGSRAELTYRWPVTYRDRLPANRRSAIQVLNPAVHSRESNSQPVDQESDVLTATPPSHPWRMSPETGISANLSLEKHATNVSDLILPFSSSSGEWPLVSGGCLCDVSRRLLQRRLRQGSKDSHQQATTGVKRGSSSGQLVAGSSTAAWRSWYMPSFIGLTYLSVSTSSTNTADHATLSEWYCSSVPGCSVWLLTAFQSLRLHRGSICALLPVISW